MTLKQSGLRRKEQHAARLQFLRDHPALAVRLPGVNQNVDAEHSIALDQAVKDLKFFQLYSPVANPDAVRWGIRLLISELRGEPLPRKYGVG